MAKSANGCAFGRESRVMINDIKGDISEVKDLVKEVKQGQTDLFNHQSTRVPQETLKEMMDQAKQIKWLYGILGAIIGGVVIGIIVRFVA